MGVLSQGSAITAIADNLVPRGVEADVDVRAEADGSGWDVVVSTRLGWDDYGNVRAEMKWRWARAFISERDVRRTHGADGELVALVRGAVGCALSQVFTVSPAFRIGTRSPKRLRHLSPA